MSEPPFAHALALFFDLDGTLVDSVPDLTAAVNVMLAQLALPQRRENQVRDWVGNGVDNLIHRALTNDMAGRADPTLFARAKPLYKAAYAEHLSAHSALYPGVREGLIRLYAAGFPMACVTNKSVEFARPLLGHLGIAQYFSTVVGGECVAHPKPAPDALVLCAERLGAPITHSLMVGDSLNDVGAARNAGCPVVCVPYGYNHGRDIREAAPDAVIDSIADLPRLLGRAA
ncbi:MAG TPA: phosphoglycolate phosphatase [Candidatus Competibacter sp.]|nr:phosphoglycolate phosphatase [Candidatus Competibacteraceae bacterium]HAO34107.1 phosphoglycolate phosphatase [Candidatus Competibacteraceae bacterium]HRE54935.1 phosphoglycolate phosphatase [Candidatus Competibacter sp.]